MTPFRIEPVSPENRSRAVELLVEQFGTSQMVSRGELWDARDHPGFLALDERGPVGVVTYRIREDACEITTVCSRERGRGAGSALIAAVQAVARSAGCRRLWLVTSNDNLPALGFYQKRGFHLVAVYPSALDEYRRLKPQIPRVGLDGIPLRDEIELEIRLKEAL
jgi:ribosomal protein S18 acetylase RimI-like enzyme